jgi:flagellar protein FlaF
MSIARYRRIQETIESPREMEQRCFSIVTGKLIDAKEQGGPPLIEACYLNQRLWSTLAADLALPSNGLPDELKARLISLSIWVNRYTPRVMAGDATPDALISVNRNIIEGLGTKPAAQPAAAGAA